MTSAVSCAMFFDHPDGLRKRACTRAEIGVVSPEDRTNPPSHIASPGDLFDEEPEIAHHLQLRLAFSALLPLSVDSRVVQRDRADAGGRPWWDRDYAVARTQAGTRIVAVATLDRALEGVIPVRPRILGDKRVNPFTCRAGHVAGLGQEE